MFDLTNLLNFDNIVIQCHDNPDADAIGSGFGIYEYLKKHNKTPLFMYSGFYPISKPNLTQMINSLKINIEFKEKLDFVPDLLITVDSQYGEGNIRKFEAKEIAIIDHHVGNDKEYPLCDIRPYLSSCSTLVWSLLEEHDFSVNDNLNLSTALYYGLFTDSNSLSELRHPLDKDMVDSLDYDKGLIRKFKNSNLSLLDLETAGIALLRCSHINGYSFAIFKSNPCDPNILGFISDLAIQVNTIDSCVVYHETPSGIKYSVRSCTNEVKANELAEFISKDLGSGGGHLDKAGGFISAQAFNTSYMSTNIDGYLLNKAKEYFESFDVIDALNYECDINEFKIYKKNIITIGYLPTTELYSPGTELLIRTIEGDLDIIASEDIYIMIGIAGEVWPIKKEKFFKSYIPIDAPYSLNVEYTPHVRNKESGENICIVSFAHQCRATSSVPIYAKPLEKNTKVFTLWNRENYMSGKVSDMLALRHDDLKDVYIINKSIFDETYHKLIIPQKKIL